MKVDLKLEKMRMALYVKNKKNVDSGEQSRTEGEGAG